MKWLSSFLISFIKNVKLFPDFIMLLILPLYNASLNVGLSVRKSDTSPISEYILHPVL